mmetsp:Transcript_80117/g.221550  ORF Transcript_80117/g.221550 Transcript_80117/m.221550 type:complete len:147 (-) Transcript_80117:12-452(-)
MPPSPFPIGRILLLLELVLIFPGNAPATILVCSTCTVRNEFPWMPRTVSAEHILLRLVLQVDAEASLLLAVEVDAEAAITMSSGTTKTNQGMLRPKDGLMLRIMVEVLHSVAGWRSLTMDGNSVRHFEHALATPRAKADACAQTFV